MLASPQALLKLSSTFAEPRVHELPKSIFGVVGEQFKSITLDHALVSVPVGYVSIMLIILGMMFYRILRPVLAPLSHQLELSRLRYMAVTNNSLNFYLCVRGDAFHSVFASDSVGCRWFLQIFHLRPVPVFVTLLVPFCVGWRVSRLLLSWRLCSLVLGIGIDICHSV